MKANRRVLMVSLLVYVSIMITSCDKVDGPYSDVTGGGFDTTDTGADSTDTISGTIYDTIRNVLIEDYTGHKCQGCPAAHDEAHSVQLVYGKRLSIIALHVGFWANTNISGTFTYDFETQTGLDLYAALVPSSQPFPTGTINRKLYGALRVVDYPQWGSKVSDLMTQSCDASMKVSTSYNETTREISATVKSTFLHALSGDYALAIYYTEDSIVNWQAFPTTAGGNVADYVHRHVLRGALTPSFGTVIATNPSVAQQEIRSNTGTPIAADINTDHVHVVAVLTNTATKEIVQVEEVELK